VKQSSEGDPADLRQRINSGELLKPGDRVLIVTTDQKTHRFTVKSVGFGRLLMNTLKEILQGRARQVRSAAAPYLL
jgi:hypothetical protein